MPATLATSRAVNLADVLKSLGDISPDRIGLPVGTATEADLLAALESPDKRLYELIDGVLVEKPMGIVESILAGEIIRHIGNFLEKHDHGITFAPDGPFRLRPGRVRFPDTGFIGWERLPEGEWPKDKIFDGSPNLAVEVISESNTPDEIKRKLKDYFPAGVELVWLIYPKTQTAEVYTSPRGRTPIDKDGVLDGGQVLPGFRLPLKKLFERRRRKKRN